MLPIIARDEFRVGVAAATTIFMAPWQLADCDSPHRVSCRSDRPLEGASWRVTTYSRFVILHFIAISYAEMLVYLVTTEYRCRCGKWVALRRLLTAANTGTYCCARECGSGTRPGPYRIPAAVASLVRGSVRLVQPGRSFRSGAVQTNASTLRRQMRAEVLRPVAVGGLHGFPW